MPKFLCLQRKVTKTPTRPDEVSSMDMQAMYAKFMEWRESFKEQIVDLGGRLGKGSLVSEGMESDGPFIEVKELVGGYMIVSATDLEQAVAIARACPGLVGPSSAVEVVEIHSPG